MSGILIEGTGDCYYVWFLKTVPRGPVRDDLGRFVGFNCEAFVIDDHYVHTTSFRNACKVARRHAPPLAD